MSKTMAALALLAGCALAKETRPKERPMSNDVIDELVAWGRTMAGGKDPDEIARHVGAIRKTVGATIYITPANPLYSDGVVTFDGQRHVNALSVDAAAGKALPSVQELEARFGTGTEGVKQFRAPLPLLFVVELGPQFEKVAKLAAYVANSSEPKAQWRIQGFQLVLESRP
jgi:hypothetical protein